MCSVLENRFKEKQAFLFIFGTRIYTARIPDIIKLSAHVCAADAYVMSVKTEMDAAANQRQ